MAGIIGNEKLFVDLGDQLGLCASFLTSRVQDLNARGQEYASRACQVLADLVQFSLEGVMPYSEGDKRSQLIAAAQVLAPLQANGLGDAVVWPGFRLAQMHRDAEEWTALTNLLRQLQHQINNPPLSPRELLLKKVQDFLSRNEDFHMQMLARRLTSDSEVIGVGKLWCNGIEICNVEIQADGAFIAKPPADLVEGDWTVKVHLLGKEYKASRDGEDVDKWKLADLQAYYADYAASIKL